MNSSPLRRALPLLVEGDDVEETGSRSSALTGTTMVESVPEVVPACKVRLPVGTKAEMRTLALGLPRPVTRLYVVDETDEPAVP